MSRGARSFSTRLMGLIGFGLLACLGLAMFVAFPLAAQAGEPLPYTLFLPLIAKPGATTPPPDPGSQGAFFVDNQWKTHSASMATDAQGRLHMAYTYYEAAGSGAPTYAVYLMCASACDQPQNWNGVGMGQDVNEVQVALTPNGSPRVLYRAHPTNDARNDFYYAACDVVPGADCTDPSRWAITLVASNRGTAVNDFNDDALPQRYFALDGQGRPGFVYNDRDTWAEPDHLGTFYVYCDTACTDKDNWSEVRISQDNGNPFNYRYEKFNYPALAFTPAGQPRVVADGTSMQDEFGLYYVACDAGCGSTANWQSASLYERGSGVEVAYDLEFDAQGRPRLAFYQGELLGGQGARLYYAWCNDQCLSVANWQRHDLGLGTFEGQDPDLELDSAGRPRIAYALYTAGGLGYAWCNSACETVGAPWQQQVVESGAALLAAWPVAYPPHCDGGLWDGLTPVLSLDSAGNPRIGYDTTYHAHCWYNPDTGEWEPFAQFHLVWRAARAVFFPQP